MLCFLPPGDTKNLNEAFAFANLTLLHVESLVSITGARVLRNSVLAVRCAVDLQQVMHQLDHTQDIKTSRPGRTNTYFSNVLR